MEEDPFSTERRSSTRNRRTFSGDVNGFQKMFQKKYLDVKSFAILMKNWFYSLFETSLEDDRKRMNIFLYLEGFWKRWFRFRTLVNLIALVLSLCVLYFIIYFLVPYAKLQTYEMNIHSFEELILTFNEKEYGEIKSSCGDSLVCSDAKLVNQRLGMCDLRKNGYVSDQDILSGEFEVNFSPLTLTQYQKSGVVDFVHLREMLVNVSETYEIECFSAPFLGLCKNVIIRKTHGNEWYSYINATLIEISAMKDTLEMSMFYHPQNKFEVEVPKNILIEYRDMEKRLKRKRITELSEVACLWVTLNVNDYLMK